MTDESLCEDIQSTHKFESTFSRYARKSRYVYGWAFVRPRRWLFRQMIGGSILQLQFNRTWDGYLLWPNPHWWLLYQTVFRFFKWLEWEAWRPFCDWTGGLRRTFPWYASLIKRVGQTTAGAVCHGGECYHCGHPEGDPIELANDETGMNFRLEGTSVLDTPDGTDHVFWGTTICPYCGYVSSYRDGSL